MYYRGITEEIAVVDRLLLSIHTGVPLKRKNYNTAKYVLMGEFCFK